MDISWDDARLFLAVAEHGSVSTAARALGATQPTVSRRLAALEAALGEPLFSRSGQGTALTAYGERLLGPARRMADAAAELTWQSERRAAPIEGVVRVTAPPGVCVELVVPFAGELATELPALRLEVAATTRFVDLVRREADLALRTEAPSSRELETLATLDLPVGLYASPALAARLGARPRLADVPYVVWAPPFESVAPNPQLARLVPGHRVALASDDYLVQQAAAEAGVGALFLAPATHRYGRRHELVRLAVEGLPALRFRLHLVCAKSALFVPRVRAVADRLGAVLREAQAAHDARARTSEKRRAAPKRQR